ncbi:MAG: hypothetical protein ACTSYR_06040, partial [Candidatus Odinarchaeia archaeon]
NEDDLYTSLEVMLAHIVFGSDFNKAKKWSEKHGILSEAALAVWRILEEHRVESLWGKLYKGSMHRFKTRRERLINKPATNLIEVLIAARGKRFDLIPLGLHGHAKYFLRYFNKVELCGPEATFIIADKIMEAIKNSSKIGEKIKKGELKEEIIEYVIKAADSIDQTLLEDDLVDIKKQLEAAKNEGLERINEISQALSKIEKIARKNRFQSEQFKSDSKSADPIRDDITTAKKLSQILRNMIYKRIYDPDNEGIELDIDEYLQWKINPQYERRLFMDEEKENEFTCAVLLDLSLSMNPRFGAYSDSYNAVGFTTKLGLAKRAATVLTLAFKSLSSVNFKVYGFSGNSNDLIVLVKEAESVYDIQKLDCTPGWALSPLHLAINVITENLRNVRGRKLLFIITDGLPEAMLYGKPIEREWLIKWTREAVKNAIQKGIQVYTIMIAPDLDEETMHTMFGSSERWTILREKEKLREVMLKYVGKQVARLIQKGM